MHISSDSRFCIFWFDMHSFESLSKLESMHIEGKLAANLYKSPQNAHRCEF